MSLRDWFQAIPPVCKEVDIWESGFAEGMDCGRRKAAETAREYVWHTPVCDQSAQRLYCLILEGK